MILRQAPRWASPSKTPVLDSGTVHVWRTRLDVSTNELGRRLQTLSPDEVIRASRFVFRRDRERYIAARGYLRRLLGHYVQKAPHLLRFAYSDHGKPTLLQSPYARKVGFNVSHAGDWALVAVASTPTVGVDVERVRADLDLLDIADTNFANGERAVLQRTPGAGQAQTFFDCWTQKEAFVKAVGEGLSIPLDTFEVDLGGAPGLHSIGGCAEQARDWTLCAADPAPGYLGALAVEGAAWDVRFFDGTRERAEPRHRVIKGSFAVAGG